MHGDSRFKLEIEGVSVSNWQCKVFAFFFRLQHNKLRFLIEETRQKSGDRRKKESIGCTRNVEFLTPLYVVHCGAFIVILFSRDKCHETQCRVYFLGAKEVREKQKMLVTLSVITFHTDRYTLGNKYNTTIPFVNVYPSFYLRGESIEGFHPWRILKSLSSNYRLSGNGHLCRFCKHAFLTYPMRLHSVECSYI